MWWWMVLAFYVGVLVWQWGMVVEERREEREEKEWPT